ncbi:helix-turn-helix domain-containing protein [Edaphobacillus lindanitolerans]|uniref:Transcriptional regulator, XRE family with cupin sensor n=1 Tax=Edaphobacillus lindanitolerans TaxID=550447 RepID=A0A1U7PIC2_9BACI|nr:cupin domain-containing protein [Edaphobacillus lindanitolerans]SIT72949.1 transcriptional regulator, XRE family with cupin sensor [Edaphobacillus lindanitolerans]
MADIHEKIRSLRNERGLTLKELAELTGLSAGFLSMIERGSSSLAITSLKKIADAFNLDITYFFESPNPNRKFHVEKADQKKFWIDTPDNGFVKLSGQFANRGLESLFVTLKPNQQKEYDDSHAGEEFYYILEGVVRFTVDGEKFDVQKGESIHFPSKLPHDYENPTDEEASMLCVMTQLLF